MQNLEEKDFWDIIKKQKIKPVFQPIVSLKNGKVIAYEALSRVTGEYKDIPIGEMFDMATRLGCLWKLEKVCRWLAMKKASEKPRSAQLFLNVDGQVLLDTEFVKGFTKENLERNGLKTSDIVFEITERSDVENRDLLLKLIKHYEMQGFAVAIDDIGSGYSGLNRLNYLDPQYVKVDYELVHDIHKSKSQRSIVGLMVSYCKEMNHVLIAEGIESKEELECLIQLGVDCGQGFYLAKPKEDFEGISEGIKKTIRHLQQQAEKKKGGDKRRIAAISKIGMVLYPECTVTRAYHLFLMDKKLKEIAVVDRKSRLYGILIRDKFVSYCKAQGLDEETEDTKLEDVVSGNALFCVAAKETMKRAARQAMSRPEEECYDAFAIVDEGRYFGIVSVRDLMRELAQREE
ncbi:MAG: EAL domain-containing protein [Lachnospiraceae bacterium]|nr:EAL domain-containing protein [Lachnospiraceae bacterium]